LLLGKAAEANERGVELQIDPASTVPEGMFPARDLVTMVGNLIDNAIDAAAAAPGPRRVGFSSWIEDAASGGGIASTLVLQVSDSGPGLDETSATQAFTRDWSTKRDERIFGHGLGLALVVQAAHRHHGTVDVGRAQVGAPDEGTPEGAVLVETAFVGAVFTIRLPLAVEVEP
jgi:two-component system CitB family sensor kinase